MSKPPRITHPETSVEDAAAAMCDFGVDSLPVVDSEMRLMGLVTSADLLARYRGDLQSLSRKVVPTIAVQQVMEDQVIAATPEVSLADVIHRMLRSGIRHVPVVDRHGTPVGLVTENEIRARVGDLRTAVQEPASDVFRTRVDDIMAHDPEVIRSDAALEEAARRLERDKATLLCVINDDDQLVGVLSYIDMLALLGALSGFKSAEKSIHV